MAFINADRVKETTTTTGTGAVTLAGAVAGFQAFSAVMAVNDTCYYVIVSGTGTDWETGTGTYSSASVLTRTNVLSSSNSGNAVSFAAGTKDVFMGPIANQVNDIAHGGTGATTAADARTNLGVGTGTVTSVAATGGTGISVTGSPITGAGTLGITNTAPDQTVSITAGTGISATGTYPNFTIALGSFTSAQLATALTDETGTGANVFANSPTLDGIISVTTGSFAHSPTTTNISSATHNLALSASAFHRLNCTTAASLTGIAPPTGIIHTDGRMIRIFNTGTANLTLTHNSTLSTAYSLNVSAGNRFWNVTAADIILAPNDYAEGTYDLTSNGSGSAGWRVA